MNFFSAVNLMTFRAYYKRLNGVVSLRINTLLLIMGFVSLISGPVLALYDSEMADKDEEAIHTNATAIFVVSQALYVLPKIILIYCYIY